MFEDDDIMLDYYEGKKAHRRFNNLAPLLEEKGLDPQLALDANYVPSGQPKEYDDQFLQNDKNFQAVGRVMYNMDVNANNKKLGTRGVEKNIPQTDLDFANYALDQLGWFNYNIPQMIYDGVSLSKATPDQRIAFYYGMKAYDRLKNFTRSGTARFFKGVVADPSTYLGLGTIGLAVRSLTKKGLTKAGWMNTLKLAGVGATEGAAYAAIDDYFRQDVAIGAEAQESFDLQKYLKFNIENPALVGAAAGGIPTAAPAVATKLGKEAIDLAKRVEIDDSATLSANPIPFRLKPKKTTPRDESSGHAADGVPAQFGPPAHNLNLEIEDEFTPEGYSTFSTTVGDNYEELRYFTTGNSRQPDLQKDELSFLNTLKQIKGNPEAVITMYRASPTDDLRSGDLITPSKTEAQFYVDESKVTTEDIRKADKQRRLEGDKPVDLKQEKNIKAMENLMDIFPKRKVSPSKIHTYKLKAKDVRWDGNNGLFRWGYFPQDNVTEIKKQ